MKLDERRSWYRGWAGFALCASLIVISVVAVISVVGSLHSLAPRNTPNLALDDAVSLVPNQAATSNFVNFTCHVAYGDLVFTIAADINLTDWMNRDEAVLVANTLFDNALGQMGELHQLKSADMDELGVWTVKIIWGISTADMGHWFLAEIDPFNLTIVYSHCK